MHRSTVNVRWHIARRLFLVWVSVLSLWGYRHQVPVPFTVFIQHTAARRTVVCFTEEVETKVYDSQSCQTLWKFHSLTDNKYPLVVWGHRHLGHRGPMTFTWCLIGYWTTKRSLTNMQYISWHPHPPYLRWHRWTAVTTTWYCRWRWSTEHNNPPTPTPHQQETLPQRHEIKVKCKLT